MAMAEGRSERKLVASLLEELHEPATLVSLSQLPRCLKHASRVFAWTTSKFHGSRGEVPARERQRAGGEGLGAGGRRELNPKSANRSNNAREAVEQDAAVRSAILTVKVLHSAGLAVF